MKQTIARTDKRTNGFSGNIRSLRGAKTPYTMSVSDGKTQNDIIVSINKDGILSTIINFHANNDWQYNTAIKLINTTTLYQTESITSLVNKLKRIKEVQFFNI